MSKISIFEQSPTEIIECEQNSPEWLEARMGIITASEMDTVLMQVGPRGGIPITRQKYLYRLAAERLTQEPIEDWAGNKNTERGKELEAEALARYQDATEQEVKKVGFLKCGFVGASPDGLLVGKHKGLEIKCVLPYTHIDILLNGTLPREHMLQIQTNMGVGKMEEWDICRFCPGLPIIIKTIKRDEEMIQQIEAGCLSFELELQETVKRIKTFY